MAEIEQIRTTISSGSDVERQLVTIAEKYGVQPRP
jgi:hypothetical protein